MCQVLVVDKDYSIREIIRSVLESEGHSIIEAGDGTGAVALLRASPTPLVALIDLHDGRGAGANPVIRSLAADPTLADRHAFIWMTTGNLGDAEEAALPVRRHGVRLVAKPFDLEVLLGSIAEAALNLPGVDGDQVPERGAVGSWSC